MPAWLSYTLLRLGLFLGILITLLVLGLPWFWAALVATVIAFCVSYIFFRRQRLALAEQWARRRPTRTRDDVAEDAELDLRSAGDREGERRAES